MTKLLRADLRRILMNPYYLLALLACAVITVYSVQQNDLAANLRMSGYFSTIYNEQSIVDLNAVYNGLDLCFSGVVSLIFILRELGGTVSVFKLSKGAGRGKVFFSVLVSCCAAAALLRIWGYLCFFVSCYVLKPEDVSAFLSLSGFFPAGAAISLFSIIAYTCAAASIGLCFCRKNALVPIAVFLALTFLLNSGRFTNLLRVRLEEPELTEVYTGDPNMPIFSDSDFETTENPEYVGGSERAVLTAVFDCFPWTQDYQFSYYENADPPRRWTFPLYSAGWILIFGLSGAAVFRRRDLL